MTCHEIKELTVPYLELDLEPSRVRQVTAHLDGCAECRTEMEAVRQVLVRLKGVAVPDPGERFWNEFPADVRRQLMRERKDQRSGAVAAAKPAARPWFGAWAWPAALAASLLVVVGTWSLKDQFTSQPGPAVVQAPRTESGQSSQSPSAAGEQRGSSSPQVAAAELPHITDAEWQQYWDDYHDMVLVEMASRLDRRTVDRLFAGI